MKGALFNLGFDEVGQTFGKKLLISREKQTQKQITINIQFSGTIMGQVSALRKLVGAESYEIHEAKNIGTCRFGEKNKNFLFTEREKKLRGNIIIHQLMIHMKHQIN